MSYHLSQRSLDKLVGVKPQLVQVVKLAIDYTTVDFGVTEGLRSVETQREYFIAGKSQTMDSKHLTGDAVDLIAYVAGQASWELNLYDDVANAMKQAAIELNVPIRWGAAWNVPDIRMWRGTMEEAMHYYMDERRKQNKRPFIDAPHFEMA
jgi:peptidoglycan L-alanyl-D-glutamate endopeptidase CwlK